MYDYYFIQSVEMYLNIFVCIFTFPLKLCSSFIKENTDVHGLILKIITVSRLQDDKD